MASLHPKLQRETILARQHGIFAHPTLAESLDNLFTALEEPEMSEEQQRMAMRPCS